jgi:MFS transporter, DHA3 family, macrolide efflux protein
MSADTAVEATAAAKEKQPGVRDALKNRNFRNLWLGQSISDFGDSLTNLTLLILVNQLTGSAGAIATMLIVLAIPQVTFGLLSGVYVDRWDRKKVMIASDSLRGLFVLGFLFVGGRDTLWLLYVVAFVQASIGTFFTPARSALIPSIVDRKLLLAANSLSQTSRILFGLLGTAAAGVIVGLTNTYWIPFTLDAFTFLASVMLVSLVVAPARSTEETAQGGNARVVLQQLWQGVKLIGRTPALSATMIATVVTMLGVGAVNVLIIPLIVNDLKVPVTWFGSVEIMQTGAMILSGSLVAVLAARLKATYIVSGTLVFMGVAIACIALISSVWHLFPILVVVGLMITPLQASISTIMQHNTPLSILGRVSAALSTLISLASLASMAFAGVVGELIGVRNVFVVGGLLTVAAGVLALWMFRGYGNGAKAREESPALPVSGGAA